MKNYDCKACKVSADRSIFLTNLFKKLSRGGKERTMEASILSRRLAFARFPTQGSTWEYWVKFSLTDGTEVELVADKGVFETLNEGQNGILTWEGETILSFESKK